MNELDYSPRTKDDFSFDDYEQLQKDIEGLQTNALTSIITELNREIPDEHQIQTSKAFKHDSRAELAAEICTAAFKQDRIDILDNALIRAEKSNAESMSR